MSKENRILFVGLGIAFVLPLVLGLLLGWPAWVTVPLLVLVLVGIYRKLVYGTRTAADQVGALLDKIGLHQGNPVRDMTAHRLAKLIERSGHTDVASEVRDRFDSPLSYGMANSQHYPRNIFQNR
ncbi:hypothetical protein SAMN04487820_101207 [Actinopolyspora mzabensis]|uniref:Uncharacterized protein n=1 Tax=Actinopolyspora mzabensis TaxID=995066 RepID=A0A1G8VNC5_ACTMZ|nr:hypothetical protein [Actinopolyspora mzabensis]SDJ67503.1 hypothetical protein SAMN04487820_101207 [Actinopolyspora mzabensis]